MKHFVALLTLFLTFIGNTQLVPDLNDILIPMRDGKFLSADVYIPDGVTEAEVVLVQTPYNKNAFEASLPLGIGLNVNDQPFIWVIVDWRGFYGSAAAVDANASRGEDGYDVCEWIIAQTWHKDRIGTWGPSALGKIQYDLAFEHHPNHTCAVPMVAQPQFYYGDFFYGGVLEEARLEQLDALGYGLSPIVMANVYYSNTWAFAESSTWTPNQLTIPTLQIGGWYDHTIDKMTDWYKACRTLSPLASQQWLLVGPWVHGGTGIAYVGSSIQGELTYPNAALVNNDMTWDFFNYYLLDSVNNWLSTPKLTYYELGENVWLNTNASTIEQTSYDDIYLSMNNGLISDLGSGQTAFTSDPNNPAPTIGGATLHVDLDQGPYNQISLESRNDIITFETVDLPSDVTINGRVKCNLYVESTQPDCDIMVHLVDVYPDGRNMLITDGARRMRFRNGYTQGMEELMTPGSVYSVEITLPFTSYTWKAGHQIKLYIGSNSSNRWNVNLQDGGTMYTNGTGVVADITIHHDAQYPSRIQLPGNNSFLSVHNEQSESVSVYPNPSTESITVNGASDYSLFEIIDVKGKIVHSGELQNDSIEISFLTSGWYQLNLINSSGIFRTKILKK